MIDRFDKKTLYRAAADNVAAALSEDVGAGDVSAELIPLNTHAHARVITREAGVFCGRPWVEETARQVDEGIAVDFEVADGDEVSPNDVLFRLSGEARHLLTAERTMLNFVQLLSGTATRTSRYARKIESYATTLLDTRKTVPGMRVGQKYAVLCGGGSNHRMGLFDAFLLKENHIAAAGSITEAIARARAAHPDIPVEVEVETLDQLDEAIAARADIVMIDDFTMEDSKIAVARAKGLVKLEASGGIDEESITEVAALGVDYISSGDLTKTVEPLDLSMRFIE